MGGTNEKKIAGLRFHVSGRKAHIHDDTSGRKFSMSVAKLKKELADLKSSMGRGDDGVALIEGDTPDMLLVGKKGRDTFAAVVPQGDELGKLKKWVDRC